MNEKQIRIAQSVADKSIEYFDRLLETARTMGYNSIKNTIMENIPEDEHTAVNPIEVLKSVSDKIEMVKLRDDQTKDKSLYVRYIGAIEVKSDKYC